MNPTRPLRHILVAHDLGETSDGPLAYALALAKQLAARVTVLHVYEVPSMGAPEVLMLATEWADQIGVVAREKLEAVVARAGDSGVTLGSDIRKGSVWREVDQYAREHDVDLIVVGSHGRRGLPRALLGSVADKVIRTAPCPVLVFRGPAEEH